MMVRWLTRADQLIHHARFYTRFAGAYRRLVHDYRQKIYTGSLLKGCPVEMQAGSKTISSTYPAAAWRIWNLPARRARFAYRYALSVTMYQAVESPQRSLLINHHCKIGKYHENLPSS